MKFGQDNEEFERQISTEKCTGNLNQMNQS